MQQLRFAEGHRFDHGVVLAAFAFHHIGGQGPGGTHKAEYGSFIANRLTQAAKYLAHKRHRLGRLQGPQCLYLGEVADWVLDQGPLALNDVEVDPHPRQGREDV